MCWRSKRVNETLQAIILGIIEGLTEFLPVSSTGHMVLAMPWLGIDGAQPPWPVFLYFIQIGAILAVVLYFWRRLWRQILTRPSAGAGSHIVTKVVVAMVPSAIVGLTLDEIMETYLEKPLPVAIALIVGAGVMILIERKCVRRNEMGIGDVSLRQAFCVGLAQCFSVVPGTSRAMATIMGGIAVGLRPAVAAEFSFYLAIPTLIGAGLVRILKHRHEITADSAAMLAVGFAVSFLVALAVVSAFMRYIQTRPLQPFAIYRILLGAVVLCWWWSQH
jgi:undecaprenyl-diphosphatase